MALHHSKKVPLAVPRALHAVAPEALRARIAWQKDQIEFDRLLARRIFKSLPRKWRALDPRTRDQVIDRFTIEARRSVNPLLKEIIIDPDSTADEPEGRGSAAGIEHIIGIEDAEFRPAVRKLVEAAFTVETTERVQPFIDKRIRNCLIALRSFQKSVVEKHRSEGVSI